MDYPLVPASAKSLADYIEHIFAQFPDNRAYSALGQEITYAEVEQKSRALAAWLLAEGGLNPGDRIAIQLPNLNQNPIAVYAALRAGLVVVNTNPLYTPREMQHQFKDSGAKALIILTDLLPKFEAIKQDTDVTTVVTTQATDLLTNNMDDAPAGCIAMNHAIKAGMELDLPPRPDVSLDDICILQYTGGTTGVSKGAALSHGNVLSNCIQMLDRLQDNFEEGAEIVICPLPLYHIYAFTVCMMAFFAKGCLTVLIPNPRDPDAFIKAIEPYQFTTFAGINTLFVGLGQHPDFQQLDFSKLKLTLSGGTALTMAAVDIWKKTTGCMITEGYGLSETSPVLTFNTPGAENLGSVGTPLIDTDIQLLDDDDQPVADGQEGQIAAKGPQIMQGYWQRPDETAKVMTSNGYFKTGDVGVRLPDGCIKIVDRLKDLIIVSGFNVYPNEVENVLTQHPAVVEAAVIGEPDDKTGEKVSAYISVNTEVEEADIVAHCREQLTAYKVPKKITIMDELPKSSVGKILRRELRK
ncbi:AMP-binding protein [Aestuariibacter salexigens]|uniref:AMP-binding protein n=1 Tax=Aestuariibacter salexigens TaxID=226010 RepID=UPI0003F4AE08|nr:AMP-binding protein [Aestuariibacter salexigens]